MTSNDPKDSFRLVVEQHSRKIFQLAYRMVGNEYDAEEVVQETFLKAYRGFDRYQGHAAVSTWLFRIASNCAIDHLRRQKKAPSETVTIDPDATAHPAQSGRQEKVLIQGQFQQHMDVLMACLTPKERTSFVLRHFQEHTIAEISETLKIQPNAVKQAIFRAVRKLRSALQKEPA